jgi:hypothetical protein
LILSNIIYQRLLIQGLIFFKSRKGNVSKIPSQEVGGESERLAVLNLTETLIYLGAISLEINFPAAFQEGKCANEPVKPGEVSEGCAP